LSINRDGSILIRMSPHLFTPFKLRNLTLANRLVVAPMCQYSAVDGCATDWHVMHLGSLAVGGAGLVWIEATGVEPRGRITPDCLGLWGEPQESALARAVGFVRSRGMAKLGIQLAHAGRKGSTAAPWKGPKLPGPSEGGWTPVAPSAVPFDASSPAPAVLDGAGMREIREAFAGAARRAARIGLEAIEVHSAHGYLLHQFLSPLSNRRADAYGGSAANRMRFPLEVFDAVRQAAPDLPVGVRVSATDWVDGGWTLAETVDYALELKKLGCDFVDVSSGGLSPLQKVAAGPGFQVPFAAEVRAKAGVPTIAVGMIRDPQQAEAIVAGGQADLVGMARAFLDDPHWPWHAAKALGADVAYPPQYLRAKGL